MYYGGRSVGLPPDRLLRLSEPVLSLVKMNASAHFTGPLLKIQ